MKVLVRKIPDRQTRLQRQDLIRLMSRQITHYEVNGRKQKSKETAQRPS